MTDMHSARSWLATVVAFSGLAHFPARMTRQRRFDRGRRPMGPFQAVSPADSAGRDAAAATSWSTPSPLHQPRRRVPVVPAGVRAGDRNHRMVRPLPGPPKRPARGNRGPRETVTNGLNLDSPLTKSVMPTPPLVREAQAMPRLLIGAPAGSPVAPLFASRPATPFPGTDSRSTGLRHLRIPGRTGAWSR